MAPSIERPTDTQNDSAIERLNSVTVRFVRHAESVWNTRFKDAEAAAVVLQSSRDGSLPLTEKGHDQAIELKDRLGPTDCIIVSTYLRTGQTSKHVIDDNKLEFVHRWEEAREFFPFVWDMTIDRFVKEKNVPKGEMKDDFMASYFERMDINEKSPPDPTAPDHLNEHESFKEYFMRVHRFIIKLGAFLLRDRQVKSPVIFSHSFFIKELHMQLTKYADVCALPDTLERDAKIREAMRGFKDIWEGSTEYEVPNVAIKEDLDPLLKKYWRRYQKDIETFKLD